MNGNMFFLLLSFSYIFLAHSAQRVSINTQNLFLLKPFASSAFKKRVENFYTYTSFLPSSLSLLPHLYIYISLFTPLLRNSSLNLFQVKTGDEVSENSSKSNVIYIMIIESIVLI